MFISRFPRLTCPENFEFLFFGEVLKCNLKNSLVYFCKFDEFFRTLHFGKLWRDSQLVAYISVPTVEDQLLVTFGDCGREGK